MRRPASTRPTEGDSAFAQPCMWIERGGRIERREMPGEEPRGGAVPDPGRAARRRSGSDRMSWSPATRTSMPASASRGSTRRAAPGHHRPPSPRARRPSAESMATLACPPVTRAWSPTTTTWRSGGAVTGWPPCPAPGREVEAELGLERGAGGRELRRERAVERGVGRGGGRGRAGRERSVGRPQRPVGRALRQPAAHPHRQLLQSAAAGGVGRVLGGESVAVVEAGIDAHPRGQRRQGGAGIGHHVLEQEHHQPVVAHRRAPAPQRRLVAGVRQRLAGDVVARARRRPSGRRRRRRGSPCPRGSRPSCPGSRGAASAAAPRARAGP